MKSKLSRVFISALSAILIGLLFVFLLEVFATEEGLLRRILILLGGDMPFGIIQILTYFLFVFGMLELRNIQKFVRDESSAYECKLLPEEEQFVLYAKDVNQIKLDTITWEKEKSRFLLTESHLAGRVNRIASFVDRVDDFVSQINESPFAF